MPLTVKPRRPTRCTAGRAGVDVEEVVLVLSPTSMDCCCCWSLRTVSKRLYLFSTPLAMDGAAGAMPVDGVVGAVVGVDVDDALDADDGPLDAADFFNDALTSVRLIDTPPTLSGKAHRQDTRASMTDYGWRWYTKFVGNGCLFVCVENSLFVVHTALKAAQVFQVKFHGRPIISG